MPTLIFRGDAEAPPAESVYGQCTARRIGDRAASTGEPGLLLGGDAPAVALAPPRRSRLMLAYELGVLWHGGASARPLRTGADAWMRHLPGLARPDRPVAASRCSWS